MAGGRIKGLTVTIDGDTTGLLKALQNVNKEIKDTQAQFDALQREIIETTEELKRLEEQAKQSSTALQEIAAKSEKLKTVGDNISGVGEKFLPATAVVAGLGTAAVKTAADFYTGMSKVAAISGATGKDLDALRDNAHFL